MKKRTKKTLRIGDKFKIFLNEERHPYVAKTNLKIPLTSILKLAMDINDHLIEYDIPIGTVVVVDKVRQYDILWHIDGEDDKKYCSFWSVFKDCTELIVEGAMSGVTTNTDTNNNNL